MQTTNPIKSSSSSRLGRVTFLDGQGELPMLEINTAWSTAEIYLNGAHVTSFSKSGEPPLLFMSQCSRFAEGQPLRGGIPVIFPWFGPREGLAQHGFARNKTWEVKEVVPVPDGSVSVRLRLPDCPEASGFPPFTADYIVTVRETLKLELVVTNDSETEPLVFENCLHTYLAVGDISKISISGLKDATYLDKVAHFTQRTETSDALQITSEVDRVYVNTTSAVEVTDRQLQRRLRIEKHGSLSTVVWNPWIAKAQQMPDFGNDEYLRMVCVESGNVGPNQLTLPPHEVSKLTVELSSSPLAA